MTTAVFFQIQSALILGLMVFGVVKRRSRSLHIRTMSVAIIWDILLIAQIELTRSAINTASKGTGNPTPLLIHLFFAISSVLLYLAMIWTGRALLKGKSTHRLPHRVLGWTTLCFRTLTFITSFWAAQPLA